MLLKPWETHGGWKPGERQGRFFWAQFSCDPVMDEFLLHQASELTIIHASQLELRTIERSSDDPLVIPRLFRPKRIYKMLGLFEELLETCKKPKGNFRFHATILLAETLRLISDDWLEHTKLDTAAPTSYRTYRRMISYLNDYYTEDIPKQNLEHFMDRKYEYLCHVFKKYANTNIQQYVHQLRTQRAKYLLHHTSKSVKSIAQEVGYPDPFHFSRIFKKIEGVAPQHYRDNGVHNHQQHAPGSP
ncbi:helix-turn-helix transcriptional regulator [Paenibacillus ginsengarvi]|uniref:helix-turn-helix transcriptional regulator n=1 Tax=Paenibacillus ginsengarvi TaxID=400777 RepID=UPI00131578A6|nr:helix-turn-helix transcriptional regulator [Paenibacillus ginsengarvi]